MIAATSALLMLAVLQITSSDTRDASGSVEWEGLVERVTPLHDGSGVTIDLRPTDPVAAARTPAQALVLFPRIPSAYISTIGGISVPPLAAIVGRVARIHAYRDERGTHVGAVESRATAGSQGYRLDYVATYFDLLADRRTVHEYSLAAGVLSQYREDVSKGRLIWVRDTIKRTLFFYDTVARARDMIRRFGEVTMNYDIAQIQTIMKEYGDQAGVIGLQPFVPSVRGDRFVGWWGGFPVRIYVDSASGLTELFSKSPRQVQ